MSGDPLTAKFPALDLSTTVWPRLRFSLLGSTVRTRLDTDLESIQRESQLRRIGRDLHDQAAAISTETVDAMAAVVTRLARNTEYGKLVEEGFGEAIVSEAATRHLQQSDA